MFARSISVDFAVVSKFAQSSNRFRREQSKEIVRSWFWQLLESSTTGYDKLSVACDRQLEEDSL